MEHIATYIGTAPALDPDSAISNPTIMKATLSQNGGDYAVHYQNVMSENDTFSGKPTDLGNIPFTSETLEEAKQYVRDQLELRLREYTGEGAEISLSQE